MKNQFLICIALVALNISACKKSKDNINPPANPPMQTINPMKEIANNSSITRENSEGAIGQYQVGIRFLVYKQGSIKKLGLRSPSAGTYRVQLYTFTTNDSITLNAPYISNPQRLAYADITIDANAAASGSAVWANIPEVKLQPWNTDGAGSVKHYGVCYNDLDKTQYQYIFPANMQMPLKFGNGALSVFRYAYQPNNDINTSPWNFGGGGGGYNNLIYSDIQFEFETTK
ncbi:MAG TPA: hypothetical protein PK110_13060 [Niabella sp.]|jgi:hypothetical protein|nr:hypothetical protein [Chitinophagaceae bacterium]HRO85748.1 hypothetical protein [Niabella sp.]